MGKSIANGDSVGECTGHVVSKGTESALSTAAATVAAEATASAFGGLFATSAIPVAGPLIAGVGAALLVGGAVSEIRMVYLMILDRLLVELLTMW